MQKLKSLLKKKDLKEFCKAMGEFFEDLEELKDEFIQLSGSVKRLESIEVKGTQNLNSLTIQKDKIGVRAIEICNRIEEFVRKRFSHYFQISSESFETQLRMKLENRYKKYKLEKLKVDGNSAVFYNAKELASDRRVMIRALKKHEFYKSDNEELIENVRIDPDRLKRIYSFKHRNIVKVLGTYLNDFPKCMILEYVEGISLKKILQTIPLTIHFAIDIGIQISDAIYYLHTHGENHKRIRPSKITIDNELRPIISPFQILDSGQFELNRKKVIEEILYASPEMTKGLISEPDDKSDQFCLALVIYEMILGKPLFGNKTTSTRNVFENRARFFKVKSFRKKSLGQLKNPQLIKIVEKMLSECPSQRYFSMEEVLIELKSIKLNKNKSTELAIASYRRSCVKNKKFSEDFYKTLFAHPSLGNKIEALFKSQEAKTNEKNRRRKLKSAMLLILGDTTQESHYKQIVSLPGHEGLIHEYYEAFMDALIDMVAKNDYLWTKYEEMDDMKLKNAWEEIKRKTLEKINSVTLP